MMSYFLMLSILAAGSHPRLYETPQDVARLKTNITRFQWAQDYAKQMQAGTEKYLAMTDDQLRAIVPAPGSTFAYGFSGCPICGASWSSWGAGGLATIDQPNQVTCTKCKHVFPDSDHPDSGGGWHDPKSGKNYYFLGCYNAQAAQEITLRALKSLAISYTITSDERYAHAAAVMFDSLADTYPTAIVGSIDYPQKDNNGRLERPQYQVARVLVLLADYLDLLCNSPEFSKPAKNAKGTIRQHVEEDIIRDGGNYCYQKVIDGHMVLTNGQADYVRGSLAAGIMLDEKKFTDVAISGPYRLQNFLDNCLDRDGQYYESSVGYSEHCLGLYVDMAEMLYNLRTAEHPNGINLYANKRFQKALVDACMDIDVLGHIPRFGDWGADVSAITGPATHYSRFPYVFSELLLARETNESARERWLSMRNYFADGDVEGHRNPKAFLDMAGWFAFHAEPVTKPKSVTQLKPRGVLGGRGIMTLRSGEAPDGRAVLMRYGASLNHGHLDDLNLNVFGLGRELTYDLGYALGSAHVQVGWSKLTASHNLVVVNERSQMQAPGSGGSPYFYVQRGPVRAMEASSEASYSSEGVKTYRRTTALLDLPKGGYLVDIFRVEGGHQHDLMWHFGGKLDHITGATMDEPRTTGSLAGPDYEWGHKVGPAGYLIGSADKPDYWNPPPGNGYGFLCDFAKGSDPASELIATYSLDAENKQTIDLRLLPQPNSEVITARAPGIDQNAAKADYTILRRKGSDLSSAFISVVEPVEGNSCINSTRRLECASPDAVGVEVSTSTGTDYILSSISGKPAVFRNAAGDDIRFAGKFGFIRISKGRVQKGVLVGGTELATGSYRLTSDAAAISGKVTAVDNDKASLTLDTNQLSKSRTASDTILYLSRSAYSHVSPYRIKAANGKQVTLDGDFVLARGQVGEGKAALPDGILNIVPLPTARNVGYKITGRLRGKLIRNDRTGETSTIIDTAEDYITLRVTEPQKFAAGDNFTIFDVQPGDQFTLPAIAEK